MNIENTGNNDISHRIGAIAPSVNKKFTFNRRITQENKGINREIQVKYLQYMKPDSQLLYHYDTCIINADY